MVLANLGLLFYMIFELGVVVAAKQPLENGFLNLLVVFLLKELIVEKLH